MLDVTARPQRSRVRAPASGLAVRRRAIARPGRDKRLRPHRSELRVLIGVGGRLDGETEDAAYVESMDRHLPDWRTRRDRLNDAPLAHEEWPDADGPRARR